MIRAIIIEDEASGLNNLKNLLKAYCPQIQVLDIQLQDGLVFQFLNQLNRINFEIIFITAFDRYAIQACSYSAIGYILKPTDPDALVEAVNRFPALNGEQMDKRFDLFTKMYILGMCKDWKRKIIIRIFI